MSPFSKEISEGTKHVSVASAVGYHEALQTPRKDDANGSTDQLSPGFTPRQGRDGRNRGAQPSRVVSFAAQQDRRKIMCPSEGHEYCSGPDGHFDGSGRHSSNTAAREPHSPRGGDRTAGITSEPRCCDAAMKVTSADMSTPAGGAHTRGALIQEVYRVFGELPSPTLTNATFATNPSPESVSGPRACRALQAVGGMSGAATALATSASSQTPLRAPPSEQDAEASARIEGMEDGGAICYSSADPALLVELPRPLRKQSMQGSEGSSRLEAGRAAAPVMNTCHKTELLEELQGLRGALRQASSEYQQLTASRRQLEPDFMALDDSALAQELAAAKADITKVSEDVVSRAVVGAASSPHQSAVSLEASLVILVRRWSGVFRVGGFRV